MYNFYRTLEIENGIKWVEITHSNLEFPEMMYGIDHENKKVYNCFEELESEDYYDYLTKIMKDCEEVI